MVIGGYGGTSSPHTMFELKRRRNLTRQISVLACVRSGDDLIPVGCWNLDQFAMEIPRLSSGPLDIIVMIPCETEIVCEDFMINVLDGGISCHGCGKRYTIGELIQYCIEMYTKLVDNP